MIRVSELPPNALRVIAVFFGLIWGSFLNVVIHRVPRGESVVKPGSKCPACGKPIRPWDNMPVFSWLILRGKARCCGVKVSPRYPIVEALGGIASIAVLEILILPMGGESAVRALAIYLTDFATLLALIVVAFIDWDWMYIPDSITYGGTVLGIATASFRGYNPLSAAIAAAAGFVITWVPFVFLYRVARGRSGMGLGDAKLLMMSGAFFGLFGVAWTLLAGAVQGVIGAFALYLLRGKVGLPEGVKEELAELKKAADAGDEEAKEILSDDPLAQDDDPDKPAYARVAFGPFLALAMTELMLYRDVILDYVHSQLWI